MAGGVLLKFGEPATALVAAERSTRYALDSGDPVAVGASARIMVHALMGSGHTRRAVTVAQTAATTLHRATRLHHSSAVSVYGALLLRGAVAAARTDDRDTAQAMLDETERAAVRLGHEGNHRWTGFGPTNVRQHRVTVAVALGDAGTAIALARRVRLDRIGTAERRASLFVDMARAFAQWGRSEQGLSALRTAYAVAPEEVRSRPAVHRLVEDMATTARGDVRRQVLDFAVDAGVPR